MILFLSGSSWCRANCCCLERASAVDASGQLWVVASSLNDIPVKSRGARHGDWEDYILNLSDFTWANFLLTGCAVVTLVVPGAICWMSEEGWAVSVWSWASWVRNSFTPFWIRGWIPDLSAGSGDEECENQKLEHVAVVDVCWLSCRINVMNYGRNG